MDSFHSSWTSQFWTGGSTRGSSSAGSLLSPRSPAATSSSSCSVCKKLYNYFQKLKIKLSVSLQSVLGILSREFESIETCFETISWFASRWGWAPGRSRPAHCPTGTSAAGTSSPARRSASGWKRPSSVSFSGCRPAGWSTSLALAGAGSQRPCQAKFGWSRSWRGSTRRVSMTRWSLPRSTTATTRWSWRPAKCWGGPWGSIAECLKK